MTAHNSSIDSAWLSPHSRQPMQRMLVVMLSVITVLLLALGIAGWWLLAGINARYSRTLSETASSLGQLHEIGLHAFTGYGNIMQLCQTTDAATRADLHQKVLAERAKNDAVFEKLQLTLSDPQLIQSLRDVLVKRGACKDRADTFIAATSHSGTGAVDLVESMKLLQDYIAYQAACNRLTDQIEAASRLASSEMAAEIKTMRWLFLAVGALPIVAGLGFLLLTLALLQVVKLDGEDD